VTGWRVRDIRRTVVTQLAEGNILPSVIEALVNHVSGSKSGVAGVYNSALHSDDKFKALTAWREPLNWIVG
jgi:ethanolamine utilization protein EutQ (cupin superfamily)